MPQAGRRGRPAGSRGRPGALAGEAGVSRGELRRQPPARGEAAAPAGLAQGDAAKPQRRSRGGREGGSGEGHLQSQSELPPRDAAGKTQLDPDRQREAGAAKGFSFLPPGSAQKAAPRSSHGGGYTLVEARGGVGGGAAQGVLQAWGISPPAAPRLSRAVGFSGAF